MKEIPWFPCIQPDLAKTIKVEEDPAGKKYRSDGMLMTIIPKPTAIWSNGEDYVCQIKYDGVRCLIAWNDDYTVKTPGYAAAAEYTKVFRASSKQAKLLNWNLTDSDELGTYLGFQFTIDEVVEEDMMSKLLSGLVSGPKTRSTSTPLSSPLKYVSREDKTRNRVNLQLITESILSNSGLTDLLRNEKLVLDGEIHSEVLELEETTGMWSSEKIKPGYESLGFRCFDCYWVDEPDLNYRQRMNKLLATAPEMPRFSYVRTPFATGSYFTGKMRFGWVFEAQLTPITSQVTEELEAALQTAIDSGEEGLIIRNWTKPYNCGRSGNNLYKLKDFGDAEFTIIDVVEGMGKFTGVPIWVCDNGVGGTFKVTASGNQTEKEDKWRRRASFMGKPLRVKYERIAKTGTPLKPISLGLRTSL